MTVHLWRTQWGIAWCGDAIEQQCEGENTGGWNPHETDCRTCLARALHHYASTASALSAQSVKLGYVPRGRS